MRTKSIITGLLILIIINAVVLVESNSNQPTNSNKSLTPLQSGNLIVHEKIRIINNNGLREFPGAGTVSDPYIISNLEIVSPVSADYDLIVIENTYAHLIVENNYLSGEDHNSGFGIILNSVQNAVIRDNTIVETTHGGLKIIDSLDVKIENNLITDNGGHGFELTSTRNIIVQHNTISFNGGDGISSLNSYEVFVFDNIVSSNGLNGIQVKGDSSNSTLSHLVRGNIVSFNSQDGVYLADAVLNTISLNQISNNLVGITIVKADLSSPSHPSSNNINLNYLSENLEGISIIEGLENSISQNLINGSQFAGISLLKGQSNIVNLNIISYSGQGITSRENSNLNSFSCNLFQNNLAYGVFLETDTAFETIYQNDFIDNQNRPQAQDNGISNLFERNYWSEVEHQDQNGDGINDNQYNIAGDSRNVDDQSVTNTNGGDNDSEATCILGPVANLVDISNQFNSLTNGPTISGTRLVFPISNLGFVGPIIIVVIIVGGVILLRKGRSNKSGSKIANSAVIRNEIGFDEYEGINSIAKTPVSGLCVTCGTYPDPNTQFCSKCNNQLN